MGTLLGTVLGTLAFLLVVSPARAAMCTSGPIGCDCSVLGGFRTINCENRNFKTIDPRGSEMHDYVTYSDNKLKKINDGAFSIFPRLQVLNLSHNFIEEIGPNTFKGAEYLINLDLSYNSLRLLESIDSKSLGNIQSLYLAGNENIGKELRRISEVDDSNMTVWLESPNLRNLSLAKCNLTRFPSWMIRGLTSLESIDISQNKIKMLPLLTIVSMCRVASLSLKNNPWDCDSCNNFRSLTYMTENEISDYMGYKFCPTVIKREDCDVALSYNEEVVRNNCLIVPVPEPIKFKEPLTFWFIVGIVAGVIIGLVILSMVCNSIVSAICKKRRTNTQRPSMSFTRENELLQISSSKQ